MLQCCPVHSMGDNAVIPCSIALKSTAFASRPETDAKIEEAAVLTQVPQPL